MSEAGAANLIAENHGLLRSSTYGGIAGSTALSVFYAVAAWGEAGPAMLVVWLSITTLVSITLLMCSKLVSPNWRHDANSLPWVSRHTHRALGVVWGSVFFIGAEGSAGLPLLEMCVAFALTAGVVGGAGFVRLGRDVVETAWPIAAFAAVIDGQYLVAAASLAFLAIVLRDMKATQAQHDELRLLRRRADAAAALARHQAEIDPLTSLSNRMGMERQVDKIIAGPERDVVVLYVDLDRFKAVNDTYGHRAGDTVLCVTADRLRSVLSVEDVICRHGGDEFFVILDSSVRERCATTIIEQVAASIALPIDVDGGRVAVTASIGRTTIRSSELDLDRAFDETDRAMYQAKHSDERSVVEFFRTG